MSIRKIGLSCIVLAALSGCGSKEEAKAPDGSLGGGPITDVQRLFPLEHNTVFSYVTTAYDGTTGIYIIEVSRRPWPS